jgi:hypothetical protein
MALPPEERRHASPGRLARHLPRAVRTHPLLSTCLLAFVIVMGVAFWLDVREKPSALDTYFATIPDPTPGRAGSTIPIPPPLNSPTRPAATPAADAPINGSGDEDLRQLIISADKSVTYEHLKKNAERYRGRPWAFTGTILEIFEDGSRTAARVSLDRWGSKPVWVTGDFTTEFVEKNQVYVVGHLAGSYSYTSQAGWGITIPALTANAMLKPAEANRLKAGKKPSK